MMDYEVISSEVCFSTCTVAIISNMHHIGFTQSIVPPYDVSFEYLKIVNYHANLHWHDLPHCHTPVLCFFMEPLFVQLLFHQVHLSMASNRLGLWLLLLYICLLKADGMRFEVTRVSKCVGEDLDEKAIVMVQYKVVNSDPNSNFTESVAVKVSVAIS